MRVRYYKWSFDCRIDGDSLVFSGRVADEERFPFLGQDDEGDYKFQFNGEVCFLVRNPITGEYWLMDECKSPFFVHFGRRYNLIFCEKGNYACHVVPKNGCASVLKTILWEDGKITKQSKEGDGFAWEEFGEKVPLLHFLDGYTGKRFIVMSEENKRIVRWMNWLNNKRYCSFYSFGLSDEMLVEEFLWSYPYVALNRGLRVDQHCFPQRSIVKWIVDEHYEGSYEMFDKLVDKVDLKDLADYHRDVLGVELLKNNVTPPEKKRFSWESLTDAQRERINALCEMPL